MWFITTVHQKPNFYKTAKQIVKHENVAINWVNEQVYQDGNRYITTGSNLPFIVDAQQAIAALYDAGVKGYANKAKAKEFTKKLAPGTFKYLRIVDKAYDTESKRLMCSGQLILVTDL